AQRVPAGAILVLAASEGGEGAALAAALAPDLRRHFSGFLLSAPLSEPAVRRVDAPPPGAEMPAIAALRELFAPMAIVSVRVDALPAPPRGRASRNALVAFDVFSAGTATRVEFSASVALEGPAAIAELFRVLAPRWRRQAVIATGAAELARAGADVQRLRPLQGFVAQEIRLSGPGEEDVAPLEALRAATEEALRRQPRR
ncbi:MAG: hypothetical protein ACKOGH_16425, partial [Alphaproteobacteria bacterium]